MLLDSLANFPNRMADRSGVETKSWARIPQGTVNKLL